MRVVSYEGSGRLEPGPILDSNVHDLNSLLRKAGLDDGGDVSSIRAFLERVGADLAHVGEALTQLRNGPSRIPSSRSAL